MNVRISLALGIAAFALVSAAYLIGVSQEGAPIYVNELGTRLPPTATPTQLPYRSATPVRTHTPTFNPHTWYAPGVNPHDLRQTCSVPIYAGNVDVWGPGYNPDESALAREDYSNAVVGVGGRYQVKNGFRSNMICERSIDGADKDGNRLYRAGWKEAPVEPMNIAPQPSDRLLAQRLDTILRTRGLNPNKYGGENRIGNYGKGYRA